MLLMAIDFTTKDTKVTKDEKEINGLSFYSSRSSWLMSFWRNNSCSLSVKAIIQDAFQMHPMLPATIGE